MNKLRALVWAGLLLGTPITATAAPTFQPTACDLPGITPDLAPRLRCGTVAVPRDRSAPDAGRFRLAIVIIAAPPPHPADPVLYIAGGPGSPLTSKTAILASHEAAIVAPDRDLILVDQRGAGRSEPALCPGLARRQLAIFAAGADEPILVEAWRDSFRACRHEMAQAGLAAEWFGTQITAADEDDVRQALGIEHWNIYAISYGTAVAMTMMALDPAPLRAVVLDSVFPPDPLPFTPRQSFDRARDLLFAACTADPACSRRDLDLSATYRAAQQDLDAAPLTMPLPGLDPPSFTLRAELFRLIVDRALYGRAGMAALHAFIHAAHDRDPIALQAVIASVVQGYRNISIGEMEAVQCRDRPSWREAPRDTGSPVSAFVPGVCADWSPLGPPPLLPEATAVPTLVLSGRADPITPPAFARRVAAAMGPAVRIVEFAHVGHGAQDASPCGERLVSAFIRQPTERADASCADHIPPVGFR